MSVSSGAFHLVEVDVVRGARSVLHVHDLNITSGETTAVLGPSGAGKSTLLRLLAGLQVPTTGRVSAVGSGGKTLRPGEVVMVFQRPALLRGCVLENAAVGLQLHGIQDPMPRVRPWLERLGLWEKARQPIRTLSGGEYQRVALARALALNPKALLLDEPTANLDPENVALIERLVAECQAETGMTVVWVTHNPFQAQRVAARALLLLEGSVVEHSPSPAFFGDGAQPRTQDFLRGRLVW